MKQHKINPLTLFFITAVFISSFLSAQTKENEHNKDEKQRPFQITLVTPIGSNGIDAYKTSNNVSINIFAGVAKGVTGVEAGILANVILKDVTGAQVAGFGNVVLGNVKGAQYAGYLNYTGGTIAGAQLAGFCNVGMKKVKGLQMAGFANVSGDSLHGVQLSGFCNVSLAATKGFQGAGFVNVVHGNSQGTQLAGFANVSTGNVKGLQASGFFNYAKKVKGCQLGFINVADSVDGVPVGFCSFVKKGLHQLEVSADELFYANVSLRTGVHKFYNVFSVGATSKAGDLLWHIGYGVGTSIKINNRLRSDIILSAQHISNGLFYYGSSELYKLYVDVEYKVADICYIAAGPTFNLYFSDTYLPDYTSAYTHVAPYSFLNETNNNGFNFKAWVGFKTAIRFL